MFHGSVYAMSPHGLGATFEFCSDPRMGVWPSLKTPSKFLQPADGGNR